MLLDPMPWPDRRAPWRCVWHATRVARFARRFGARVIHCNEHDVYPFVHMLRRFLRLPAVCHVRYKLDRGFAEWAFSGSRAPDALFWTSHQQRIDSSPAIDGLVPNERQFVMPLGVDLDSFGLDSESGRRLRRQWGIADSEILIGIPSPLRPRKRIEDFIELIRKLAPCEPRIVGIVAGEAVSGDEAYRQQIERQVAESQLGRRLRWVGFLDPVEPFHQACDISVSTSEYETFGNSVCEAMACGTPVVGYRGGSIGEVVGDAGLIVETGDLDGLTAAVKQLVQDAALRSELGTRGRERVIQHFNPAVTLEQLMRIYENLATGLQTGAVACM